MYRLDFIKIQKFWSVKHTEKYFSKTTHMSPSKSALCTARLLGALNPHWSPSKVDPTLRAGPAQHSTRNSCDQTLLPASPGPTPHIRAPAANMVQPQQKDTHNPHSGYSWSSWHWRPGRSALVGPTGCLPHKATFSRSGNVADLPKHRNRELGKMRRQWNML